MRYFNTEGICNHKLHYMVDLKTRLEKIKTMISRQEYLYIQNGRQYGKTTTLLSLREYLKKEYIVLLMDFQDIDSSQFDDSKTFAYALVNLLNETVLNSLSFIDGLTKEVLDELQNAITEDRIQSLADVFPYLRLLCEKSERPIVLIIDEVDSATNNQIFIDFLSLLRSCFLKRTYLKTFQSVILAGVYDIKYIKLKLRDEKEHKYNSPWNIAATLNFDMDFSVNDIEGMIIEYEKDHHTGMDIKLISQIIYDYTSGYPYLVSYICKQLDEVLVNDVYFKDKPIWSFEGINLAVKRLLQQDLPLFGSLKKHIEIHSELKKQLWNIIYCGIPIIYSPMVDAQRIGVMLGYLRIQNSQLVIANRIFEMLLQNMFEVASVTKSPSYLLGDRDKSIFIQNGMLDMDLVLKKFAEHYEEIFSKKDEKYLESFGREIFLLYLKPIINGTGNYYLEAQTRNQRRTDVVVDYLGEQFIIEMKIWHGEEYNKRGEQQLIEYLDYFKVNKGYMLSFNFNNNKKVGVKEIKLGDKTIIEVVV